MLGAKFKANPGVQSAVSASLISDLFPRLHAQHRFQGCTILSSHAMTQHAFLPENIECTGNKSWKCWRFVFGISVLACHCRIAVILFTKASQGPVYMRLNSDLRVSS